MEDSRNTSHVHQLPKRLWDGPATRNQRANIERLGREVPRRHLKMGHMIELAARYHQHQTLEYVRTSAAEAIAE